MLLDYAQLKKAYHYNLENNLRGFKGGPGHLETWACDEDDVTAITDLIDLSIDAGQEIVTVRIPDGIDFPSRDYRNGILIKNGNEVKFVSARTETVMYTLRQCLQSLGLPHKVTAVDFKRNLLTIDYEEIPGERPLHESLIKLEDLMSTKLTKRVYLQTMNIDDKNKRSCRVYTRS